MYLYSVTVKIDLSKHDDWLLWMQTEHIPEVMKTELFQKFRVCKLMEQDESSGVTYTIQYQCKNIADYFTYQREFAPKLQRQHAERYANHFVAFRTLLKIVTESG
ncbi:MAG: DUF4286 family protein [Sphingobacteriales bacterium]|nr:MAG: DUF4286 family protein [Sphingobacteriales bacterium]